MGNLQNLLVEKTKEMNVLLLGLKQSGKTFFLLNSLLDEDWGYTYMAGLKQKKDKNFGIKLDTGIMDLSNRESNQPDDIKNLKLDSTVGFNREIISFTEGEDFCCWDVGGCNITGERQNGEYFPKGRQLGIKLFVQNISVTGIIWMVNVSQDIEEMLLSKEALHDMCIKYFECLENSRILIVYNKLPNINQQEQVFDDQQEEEESPEKSQYQDTQEDEETEKQLETHMTEKNLKKQKEEQKKLQQDQAMLLEMNMKRNEINRVKQYRKKIQEIKGMHTECLFDQEQLDQIFGLEVLLDDMDIKVSSIMIESENQYQCYKVFQDISSNMQFDKKERKRMAKRQKLAAQKRMEEGDETE